MGFLGKLSKALHGSGVHVDLSAPPMLDLRQPALAATVMLTARDEPKTVTEVTLALVMEVTTQVDGYDADGDYDPQTQTDTEDLLWVSSRDGWALQPGVPVQVPFNVALNGPGIAAMAASGTVGARMMAMMNDPMMMQSFFEQTSFQLQARATVEGSHLHPGARQRISIAGAAGGMLM